jgi:regulator of protease activity HflC (stomatin/prohibitin superfamily)
MTDFNEETIGQLLRLLPPAPQAWIQAAQELPAARAALDELVARAERDAEFRQELEADLERALAATGYEGSPAVVSRLRRLLESVE